MKLLLLLFFFFLLDAVNNSNTESQRNLCRSSKLSNDEVRCRCFVGVSRSDVFDIVKASFESSRFGERCSAAIMKKINHAD